MSTENLKILIIGATGGVGICLIREVLVTLPSASIIIYARTPSKLPEDLSANASVTIVKGTLEDLDTLDTAMSGVNVVLSALGPSVPRGPFHPMGCPLAHAYKGILSSMKYHGVTRLIALGTPSMKDPNDAFSYKFWLLITGVTIFARTAYNDVVAIAEVIRSTGEEWKELEWTIARVPLLDNTEERKYLAGYIGGEGITTCVSRKGYAGFVVDEIGKREWVRKAPVVCSPY